MKMYFTSDPHFGHSNIIRYCNRPFQSVEEMDAALINNWNSCVGKDDLIYILGDVFFCNEQRAIEIMKNLNGKKHLVLGNHDRRIRKAEPMQRLFDKILPDLFEINIDGIYVVMCHYPMLSWNRAYHGSFMLHGHCHNNIAFDSSIRRMDVGVDAQNYKPISWESVKEKLLACKVGSTADY